MFTIKASSANQALADGIELILTAAVPETSRNGDVLVVPGPVCIEYTHPWRRVVSSPTRDANPFFHLAESLWMLAGRNDLAFLQKFVKTFDAYSDDGVTLHGAYGHRWRNHFGQDQLLAIVEELRANPNSRRAVLGMWDPSTDLQKLREGGKDVPCNTQAFFDLRGGQLNMTVTNRSNDAIFGCFGANVVHFSFLLEYMASVLQVPMGVYRQFTNNLHAYTNVFSREKLKTISLESEVCSDWNNGNLMSIPWYLWEAELFAVLNGNYAGIVDPFLANVAIPTLQAWNARKAGAPIDEVLAIVEQITSADWRVAMTEWLERRRK